MYYIMTNNKEIVDFAKKKGANILNSDESMIIKPEVKKVAIEHHEQTKAEKFISSFPFVDMNSIGARALVYILDNINELRGDIRETVYPYVAEVFNTRTNSITQAISCTVRRCISRYPNKECREYFTQHECGGTWSTQHSLEFVKLCKMYLKNDNKKTVKIKGVDGDIIEAFFNGFYYANKKTLGFKCVKYILESGIDCVKNDEDVIYNILADKFNTKVKTVKQSLTYFLNNCRFNSRSAMPKEFKSMYEKNIKYEGKTIEQMNFAFISICEKYLRKFSKK